MPADLASERRGERVAHVVIDRVLQVRQRRICEGLRYLVADRNEREGEPTEDERHDSPACRDAPCAADVAFS